jgi:excisionase family DNA binding protein
MEFLTIVEAARCLRLSRSRVYQLAIAGRIPSHQVVAGGKLLFKPSELEPKFSNYVIEQPTRSASAVRNLLSKSLAATI